jgi:hypothetical protein
MAYKIIDNPSNEQTDDIQFWFIYNLSEKRVISPIKQVSGYTSSPHIMVIADTEEELLIYIEDNDLIFVPDEE